LGKFFNPKSLSAFHALGGLAGLKKGLRTDLRGGLSSDETVLDAYDPLLRDGECDTCAVCLDCDYGGYSSYFRVPKELVYD